MMIREEKKKFLSRNHFATTDPNRDEHNELYKHSNGRDVEGVTCSVY